MVLPNDFQDPDRLHRICVPLSDRLAHEKLLRATYSKRGQCSIPANSLKAAFSRQPPLRLPYCHSR